MDLLKNKKGRAFLVFALYLSEGAPIGFIWWALPTILRKEGVGIESISSLTALLVLPWVGKFIWAPLVDSLRTARYGFKTWIFFSQLTMGAALLPLLFIPAASHFHYWIAFLILHSFAAATQDVAIDALAIHAATAGERGMLNGFMQAGMLTGRSIFGGGALIMVSSIGLQGILFLLIAVILFTMILLVFTKEPVFVPRGKKRFRSFIDNLTKSFGSRNTWLVILFALTSAAAFEAAGGLSGPFLTDIGIPEKRIGFFFLIPTVVAMLAGGLAGGKLSDMYSRKKSVGIFLCGFVVSVMVIALIKMTTNWQTELAYFTGFGIMYFFVGMFTAASYAFYMDHTRPQLGATQFSTYMAATNGCESWTVWIAGKITGAWDYPAAFLIMAAVSLLSLFILARTRLASYT